jgi:hypothetical protein
MFTKVRWDKSFIFNNIRLRREWLSTTKSDGMWLFPVLRGLWRYYAAPFHQNCPKFKRLRHYKTVERENAETGLETQKKANGV